MKPELTSNIQDFISIGKNVEMTYYNSSIVEKVGNIEYAISNVIDDYMDEINSFLETVKLSDLEYLKYRYKPKLLAYDIYGSTDLDFLILKFNNILSAKDFNLKKVKLLRPNNLILINKIYNAEKSYIDDNRYELERRTT